MKGKIFEEKVDFLSPDFLDVGTSTVLFMKIWLMSQTLIKNWTWVQICFGFFLERSKNPLLLFRSSSIKKSVIFSSSFSLKGVFLPTYHPLRTPSSLVRNSSVVWHIAMFLTIEKGLKVNATQIWLHRNSPRVKICFYGTSGYVKKTRDVPPAPILLLWTPIHVLNCWNKWARGNRLLLVVRLH